jgi:DNA replication and repair protein RecF
LAQFRNYEALTWRPGARLTAIFGPNGSGKTNLLEAVSLLGPGRGLRGARNHQLARHAPGGIASAWSVFGRFSSPLGIADIGTGMVEGTADRRAFRIDGTTPRNQAEIAAHVSLVWLTPQMDRLFQDGPAGRRRFLDRLAFALEPSHARELAAHAASLAERNRLLASGGDASWLASVEDSIARHAVAVTAARMTLVARLNATLAGGVAGFPQARMALLCPIAERLETSPAAAVEDWLRASLASAREPDRGAGGATLGAHRADMALSDAGSGIDSALASTGQQKALLIGVVLGHAALLREARGFAPLLLLDEPLVHLDQARRAAFFTALERLPVQALLTGTDREAFLPAAGLLEGLRCGAGRLEPDPAFLPPTPG